MVIRVRLTFFILALAWISGVARPVTERDLVELTDISTPEAAEGNELVISPNGRYVAIHTRRALVDDNRIVTRWLAIALDGSRNVVDAGDGGAPILINGIAQFPVPQWSEDSKWIFFRADHGDGLQLWRSRLEDGFQEQLTDVTGGILDFCLSAGAILYSVDSSRSAVNEARRAEALRGFLYDDRFSSEGGTTQPIRISQDELSVEWRTYDFRSRQSRLATEREHLASKCRHNQMESEQSGRTWLRQVEGLSAWLEPGHSAMGYGMKPALTVVASYDADSVRQKRCMDSRCSGYFTGLWIDNQRDILFLRWANGLNYGPLSLYRWQPKSGRVTEVLRTSDLLQGCARHDARLVCTRQTLTHPTTVAVVDLFSGQSEDIFDPNQLWGTLDLGTVTEHTWQDANGTQGYGHLILPTHYDNTKRYPLIVVQYRSRGFLRGGVGDEYPIQVFASRGFAVLSFNRPDDWASFESSATVDELQAKLYNGQSDRRRVLSVLLAGIDRFQELGVVDPARIGITGLSDGGLTGAFALIHAASRFAAASLSWVHTNPVGFYLSGPLFQRNYTRWGVPSPIDPDGGDFWQNMSLAHNAEVVRAPLLIQASDEEFLPETMTFAELRRSRKAVELYAFPDEHHIKSQPMHRFSIYRRNLQWFQFWLQGVEVEDPLDPQQYTRWRQLRAEHMAGE